MEPYSMGCTRKEQQQKGHTKMTNLSRAIDLLSSAANETNHPEAKRLIQEAEKIAIKAEDLIKELIVSTQKSAEEKMWTACKITDDFREGNYEYGAQGYLKKLIKTLMDC